MAEPKWLDLQSVLAMHDRLIAEHGGSAGVRDQSLLESALDAPRNRFAYGGGDLAALAASYAYAISRNHPFVDGNKRTALTCAGVFLMKNGFQVELPEMEAFAMTYALAAREIGEEEYAAWLRERTGKP